MAVWSTNHRACTTTWSTLLALAQFEAAFPEAGEITMEDCLFWTTSGGTRELRARTLAQQLDNIFRMLRQARYEEGVTQDVALAALVGALLDRGNSVADLAEVADALYLFWQEGET